MICLPNGETLCEKCPVQKFCKAYQKGLTQELPIRLVKTKRKVIDVTVFLLKYQEQLAIWKRPNSGLLAGLFELPNVEKALKKEEIDDWLKQHQLKGKTIQKYGKNKHVFSHITWNMEGYAIEVEEKSEDFLWINAKDFEKDYAIPTAFLPFVKEYKRG